ncbi:hypothetical protein [Marinospirillum perlucidum]|uniref:hypothetical protein n=1 Tax=Marinospirillum perlucidum TaxID=1982602 RepID=UPI000DF35817|nr:hypothetical protein [Marinospirillum perlucidum]
MIRLILLICLLVFLTGCAAGFSYDRNKIDDELQSGNVFISTYYPSFGEFVAEDFEYLMLGSANNTEFSGL